MSNYNKYLFLKLALIINFIFLHSTIFAQGPKDGATGLPTYADRQQDYINYIKDNHRSAMYDNFGVEYIAWWLSGRKPQAIAFLEDSQGLNDYVNKKRDGSSSGCILTDWKRAVFQRLYYIVKDDPAMTSTALNNLKGVATSVCYGRSIEDLSAPILYEDLVRDDWENRKWSEYVVHYNAHQIEYNKAPVNLGITIRNILKMFVAQGWQGGEYRSPSYEETFIWAFYDLYDFSMEPNMREAAHITLDWFHLRQAHTQIYSISTGPWRRNYYPNSYWDNLNHHNSANMKFLTFGNNIADVSYFVGFHSPIRVATSSYRPHKVIDALAWDRLGKGEYEYQERYSADGSVNYFHSSPYFILSSGYGAKAWEILLATGNGQDFFSHNSPDTKTSVVKSWLNKNAVIISGLPSHIPPNLDRNVAVGAWQVTQKGNTYVAYAQRGSSYILDISDIEYHVTFNDFKAFFSNKDPNEDPYITSWGVTLKVLTPMDDDVAMQSPWVMGDINGVVTASYDGFNLTLDISDPENPLRNGSDATAPKPPTNLIILE